MIRYDIFVNCNSVDTRWQQYSTHLHTNSTQNNTINKNNTVYNKNNTVYNKNNTVYNKNNTINNLNIYNVSLYAHQTQCPHWQFLYTTGQKWPARAGTNPKNKLPPVSLPPYFVNVLFFRGNVPSTRCSVLSLQVPVVSVRHFPHIRFTFLYTCPCNERIGSLREAVSKGNRRDTFGPFKLIKCAFIRSSGSWKEKRCLNLFLLLRPYASV